MTILLNGLKFFIASAIAGKLMCIQHVFVKYSKIVQQVSENSYEAFSLAAAGAFFLY